MFNAAEVGWLKARGVNAVVMVAAPPVEGMNAGGLVHHPMVGLNYAHVRDASWA